MTKERREERQEMRMWILHEKHVWLKSGFTVSLHVCLIFMLLLHVQQI